jgi:patatin-like phospholipase/acyl hydrolase
MTYRILSLDGGGSWALIQVRALMRIHGEGVRGHQVLSNYDLVAANSGGSIVLAGLIENLTLADLLTYFKNEQIRRAVFSPTPWVGDRILNWLLGIGPKYSAANKLPALQELMQRYGAKTLQQAASEIGDIRFLVTAFDFDRRRVRFFRSKASKSHSGVGDVSDVTLAQAVHASTNAPVNYFDAPALLPKGDRAWDGAIAGFNNPVLAAVTQAIDDGEDRTQLAALSIGTGSVALPWPMTSAERMSRLFRQPSEQSLTADLRKLAGSILDDPPDTATYMAHMMCNDKLPKGESRIVRLNPLISPVKGADGVWRAPGRLSEDAFVALMNIDMDAVEQRHVDAIDHYTNEWLADETLNQPVRMNGDTLVSEVGKMSFSAALADWQRIRSGEPALMS